MPAYPRKPIALAATSVLALAALSVGAAPAAAAPGNAGVVSVQQVFQEKDNGRISVTLTFNEAIDPGSLPQGWYGSGTTFSKAFYKTQVVTVPYTGVDDKSGSTYTFTVDKTAATVVGISQAYQAKEGGRIAVTLTFDEPVAAASLPQGWYGSGTVFTKVFYSSKSVTVPFKDLVGNSGSYTFTVDKTPASVVDVQQAYNPKGGGRVDVTITFSEDVVPSSLPQGWYGSGKVYTKSFYKTQSADVTATDLVGNPGVWTINVVYTPPVVVTLAPAARVAEAPVELVEAPAEQAPAVEAPAEEAPVEEAPAEVVTEDAPAEAPVD